MTPDEIETLIARERGGVHDSHGGDDGAWRQRRTQLLSGVLVALQHEFLGRPYEMEGIVEKLADSSRDGEYSC